MKITGRLLGKMQATILLRPILVLMLVCAVNFVANSQTQNLIKESDVLVFAEEMPAFPNGSKALIETIVKTINYPLDAIEKKVEGKVHVRFIITKEGKAVQPSIIKGLLPSLDAEVIKAIKKLPKFIPGKNSGAPVNVWYALPISFKLSQ
jgi:TonB family protein